MAVDPSGDPLSTRVVFRDATLREGPGTSPGDTGAESDEVPQRIGRYQVTATLGRGGMGVVYAARDTTLGRAVAIKLVRASRLAADAGARARLVREAQSIAQLSHPNVVEVYEIGRHGDEVFVAMELVDGTSLRQWRDAGPRASAEILAVLRQAGQGLAAAHRAGIVHRDFKPDNIMVSRDGRVRVLDFGLARPGEPSESGDGARVSSIADDHLTQTGTTMGTPAYMAPEQFVGGDVDGRTDVFAFCVVAIEALSGRRPFAGRGLEALAVEVTRNHVDPAALRGIPRRIARVLRRGLAPRREDRWPDMSTLLAALADDGARRVALAGVAVAAIAAVAVALVDTDGCADDATVRAGLWDTAAEQRVRSAIVATEVPRAEAIWDRVRAAVDGRVEAWAVATGASCRASGADVVVVCLEQRRVELVAAIDALAGIDRATVHNAERVITSLPGVDGCRSPSRMAPAASSAPLAQARARLAAASAFAVLGRYPAATAELDAAPTLEGEADPDGVAAQLHHRRAEIARATGDDLAAAAAFERAYFAALDAGRDDLAARAASELAAEGAVGYRDRWQWAAHAKASFERLGAGAPPLEYDRAMCALQRDSGAMEQAIEHCARALVAAEADGATIDDRLAALRAFADVRTVADELEVARDLYARALDEATATLGEDHPKVADAMEDLGTAQLRLGQTDLARPLGERALAVRQAQGDVDDPRLARSWSLLAAVDHETRAYAKAKASFERVLALQRRHLGDAHHDVARSWHALALAQEEHDERGAALTSMAQAAAIEERLHPLDIARIPTLRELARMAFEFGAGPTAGREHLERAWAIVEKSGVPMTHPLVKDLDHGYGETLLALGELDAAIPHLERFVADPRPSPILPHLQFVLARALWKAERDRPRAIALVDAALRTWDPPRNDFQHEQVDAMAKWQAATDEARDTWNERQLWIPANP